jgi:cell division protein FtsB
MKPKYNDIVSKILVDSLKRENTELKEKNRNQFDMLRDIRNRIGVEEVFMLSGDSGIVAKVLAELEELRDRRMTLKAQNRNLQDKINETAVKLEELRDRRMTLKAQNRNLQDKINETAVKLVNERYAKERAQRKRVDDSRIAEASHNKLINEIERLERCNQSLAAGNSAYCKEAYELKAKIRKLRRKGASLYI